MFTHEADAAIAACAEVMGANTEAALTRAFEGYDAYVQKVKNENADLKAELARIKRRIRWLIDEDDL